MPKSFHQPVASVGSDVAVSDDFDREDEAFVN
jgi:hypothetical protein